MSEWKTIDSAPKDGTWFNAYVDAFLVQTVFPCTYDEDSGLFVGAIDLMLSAGLLPTHWQPLPEPPK